MKDQFRELTFKEFLEEITRQEQSFFKKKRSEMVKENPELSIKDLFPPMPKITTSENNAYNTSTSKAKFEQINVSEKMPNSDIVVNEMQKGKGQKEAYEGRR
ncbi:hypothetical protein P3L10_033084 [Capsicum annuum]|uniref:uncharacterized protein LOC107849896 n=1 Tax=Capsicum annuum TaxID=4072 RepID=UPI0007BEB1A5|nr:uncharacterized protein LOC107849896 [Capsicum annuum]